MFDRYCIECNLESLTTVIQFYCTVSIPSSVSDCVQQKIAEQMEVEKIIICVQVLWNFL